MNGSESHWTRQRPSAVWRAWCGAAAVVWRAWCGAAAVVCIAAMAVPTNAAAHTPRSQSKHHRAPGPTTVAPHWVGAWEGAPESGGGTVDDQSFRLNVHTSIGGSELRLRFSNAYGTSPLTLKDVTVALPVNDLPLAAVQASTLRHVSFSSGASLTIPAGQNAYSLPVAMTVPGNTWLTVSFYVPGKYPSSTFHDVGMDTSFSTMPGEGDDASDADGHHFTEPTISWTYLTGIDVVAPKDVSTIVALGDSITDCCIEIPDSNRRWPDLLDQRLATQPGGQRFSVVDAGISGNDVSNDRGGNDTQGAAGDTRDVRDVFDEPNVSNMILFEGVNDIGTGANAAQIEAAYLKIVAAAHNRGIRIIISTITPMFGNVTGGDDYTTNSAVRNQVNSWILGHQSVFDGVLNFAKLVENPLDPNMWNPALTIGDQLHPNPLGLQLMASSIPLDLFKAKG